MNFLTGPHPVRNPSKTNPQYTVETEPETEDPASVFDLPATNFEGKTVNILGTQWYSGISSPWSSPELNATELNGEAMNDAIVGRNTKIESTYNVDLNFIAGEPYLASVISNDYVAGTNSYDIAFPRISEMVSISGDGIAYNLNNVNNIDLTKNWWSQSARKSLTINGATFFMSGDISYMDKYTAAGLFFNKDVASSYNITSEELYALVDEGKWTYDAFLNYANNITNDSNGDGVLDEKDTWGLSANQDYVSNVMHYWDNPYTMVIDGELTFTANSEHAVDIIDRMINMLQNNIIYANSWDIAQPVFTENRALFYLEVAQKLSDFRSMEFDFGILPPMKYDETQDAYYTTCATLTTMVCIPKTTPDKDFAGFMLEALAYESSQTVIPAYIEKALESKYARDERTADMLHIIFDGIVYDIGYHTDLAGLSSVVSSMRSSLENTAASRFAALQKAVSLNIEKINESYKDAE